MTILPADINFAMRRWTEIAALLEKGMPYTNGEAYVDDIKLIVSEGRAQMFVALDADKIQSVVVTELVQYPQLLCLRVTFLAGDDIHSWGDDMDTVLMAWAKASSVQLIEGICRTGMKKMLSKYGFENSHVVMTKRV